MAKKLSARRLPYALSSPLFRSMSRRLYPRTIEDSMSYASELWRHHGLYTQSLRKAIRYFMTKVEIKGEDLNYSTKNTYEKFLKDNFNILGDAAAVGDDCLGWGNGFTSVHIPFSRTLICPCGMMYAFKYATNLQGFKYDLAGFRGHCTACQKDVTLKVKDTPKDPTNAKIKVIRWPPQYVRMRQHPLSGRTVYSATLWDYDWLADNIRAGDPMFLEETPMEMIESIVKNEDFEFAEDTIYHMKLPSPIAIECDFKGWGMPLFMNAFEDAIRLSLLDRMNEAIILDNAVPFKVLSPPEKAAVSEGGGALDGMHQIGMDKFAAAVKGMIVRHGTNPTGWNFFPYPLQQQLLGGGAKDMLNIDVMEHLEKRLLRAMGVPVEFDQSNLNSAGPVIGLRMFEREWQFFGHCLNDWLTWLVHQQGNLMQWKKVHAELIPVSLYEDASDREIMMNLANAGKISDATLGSRLNLDLRYEKMRIQDEQDEQNERMMTRQKQNQDKQDNTQGIQSMSPAGQMMQQQQQQGAPGQGQPPPQGMPPSGQGQPPPQGMPPSGPGNGQGPRGATLDDLLANAQQTAQQLFGADPLTRRRQLADLKHNNEQLYNQVSGELDRMSQDARTKGVQAARQGQLQ